MPTLRTLRRVCIFGLLVYGVFYLCSRWPGSNLPVNNSGALHMDTVNSMLRNAVDKALDEAVSDILLASNALSTSSPSRQDLKRILETQEALSSAQWRMQGLGPDQPSSNPSSLMDASNTYAKVCHLLSGKRVLFVGPETTFFLHNLWLESQEKHEHQADACFGRDYCTFHHICRSYNYSGSSSSFLSSQADLPPIEMVGRKKKMPSKNTLRLSGSSVLQYTMSSTLYAARDPHDAGYTRPLAMVDAHTGVRMPNTHWLGRARKADVLVLSRAPMPAPAWTYGLGTAGRFGNWTFAEAICAEYDLLHLDGGCTDHATRLTNVALHTTLHTFVPSVLAFLRDSIAGNGEIMRGSVLLWHGSWCIEPICAARGVPRSTEGPTTLLTDIWPAATGERYGDSDKGHYESTVVPQTDPWSFYYNAQVYMHDRILPKILPHFNITYISLAAPAASETGSQNANGSPDAAEQTQYSPLHRKDCIRSPWPGFGARLETTFKKSLVLALQHAT